MDKLTLHHVQKNYRQGKEIHAVLKDVNMEIPQGQVIGLIGRSGAGKSTLIRLIMQLEPLSGGDIRYEGEPITRNNQREFYRSCQLIFQNPSGSLNPSWTIGKILQEPLKATGRSWGAYEDHLLERLGLSPGILTKRPYQISGGQQQRVNILRALFMRPEVLICDEIVSALDRVTQHQLVHLLEELKEELNLTILFISHDLTLVGHISDQIYHLEDGKTVKIV